MKMKEVREIVKKKGVDTRVGRKKEEMIRDYQIAEGYSPCFHTRESCWELCLWKDDCLDVD
ncbi:MAG TPA: hypothetical protein VLZ07_10135 [Syntrophales bacterium]|nr:hypothetical protein [Syntrophales bacterium]